MTAAGGSSADDAGDCVELRGDVTGAALDGVGRAERSVAGAYLLLGLMGQRHVDQVQQLVVLPEADAERDRNRDQRNDQPRAELVEVADDAELIAVPDRRASELVRWRSVSALAREFRR